ncbi:MAG: DMT family transporter [Bacteroidetes bacterium]|jgi:drug/metabolite transporter (DMT)-like permease|nr:DMT family transporter [Bacteroidota bacterium]
MKNQRKATLFALLTVLFWSTMSSAFKLSLGYFTYDWLLFWSVVFGWSGLIGLLAFRSQLSDIFPKSKKDWMRSALMGLLNPFGYYLVLFKAYELLQAQEAGVLNYSWPVILTLLSVPLLGQNIGFKGFIAILISFPGLWVISTKGAVFSLSFNSPIGVGLALGSAFIWALYWIINMRDKRKPVPKITLNISFGLVYMLLYSTIFNNWQPLNLQGILGAAYIGFFEMGFTFVLWMMALNYSVNTAKVSNLIFLSPFVALFFIRIFVGEQIHPSTLTGLFLIIAGILLQQTKSNPFKMLPYVSKN